MSHRHLPSPWANEWPQQQQHQQQQQLQQHQQQEARPFSMVASYPTQQPPHGSHHHHHHHHHHNQHLLQQAYPAENPAYNMATTVGQALPHPAYSSSPEQSVHYAYSPYTAYQNHPHHPHHHHQHHAPSHSSSSSSSSYNYASVPRPEAPLYIKTGMAPPSPAETAMTAMTAMTRSDSSLGPPTPLSCCSTISTSSTVKENAQRSMLKAKRIHATVPLNSHIKIEGRTMVDEVVQALAQIRPTEDMLHAAEAKMQPLSPLSITAASPVVPKASRVSPNRASRLATLTKVHNSKVKKKEIVKRFRCGVCAKMFAQKTQLDTHTRAHTGEKPYHCRLNCGKSFSQSGNRKTHERLHTPEKPYHCRQCGRSFAQSGNRSAHEKKHNDREKGEKPYACPFNGCGKCLTELGNLKNHMNKYHQTELDVWKQRLQECKNWDSYAKEDQELMEYLGIIYKNSNKGVQGRGKGVTVSKLNITTEQLRRIQARSSQPAPPDQMLGSSVMPTLVPHLPAVKVMGPQPHATTNIRPMHAMPDYSLPAYRMNIDAREPQHAVPAYPQYY